MKISIQTAIFSQGWQPPKETTVTPESSERIEEAIDYIRVIQSFHRSRGPRLKMN